MPKIYSRQTYAQRVIMPNGGRSTPFISPFRVADMKRFSKRIIEGQWPENVDLDRCYDERGVLDDAKVATLRAQNDWDSGSSRLSFAHDGQYWRAAGLWSNNPCLADFWGWNGQFGPLRMPGWSGPLVPGDDPGRRLSCSELAILFRSNDYDQAWRSIEALGISEPVKCLARTILSFAPHVEEWPEAA